MQKKLIALAVASLVSGGAFAQSSVTLYGSFDGGIRRLNNFDAAGNSRLTMDSSGTYNSNRWGVRGSEDLGSGMKANFNLEGGFMTGTGRTSAAVDAALFGRKAIVGLSGNWGAVDMGRNYTAIFYTTAAYDPFKYKYTGIVPIVLLDGTRRDNDIQYTGTFGGVTVRAEHTFGQVAGSNTAGTNNELGVSYAGGPFNVGAAFGSQKDATNTALKTDNWTVGGGYRFGAFEVMGGYHSKETDLATGNTTEANTSWLGGRWAMSGANALTVAYYHQKVDSPLVATAVGSDSKNKLWIVGFVHNLSKRTELYADIDHRTLEGSAVLGFGTAQTQNKQLGFSVGMNHAF